MLTVCPLLPVVKSFSILCTSTNEAFGEIYIIVTVKSDIIAKTLR